MLQGGYTHTSNTYNADSWCQVLPTILHERPRLISNHVLYIIIQTFCTWKSMCWHQTVRLLVSSSKLWCEYSKKIWQFYKTHLISCFIIMYSNPSDVPLVPQQSLRQILPTYKYFFTVDPSNTDRLKNSKKQECHSAAGIVVKQLENIKASL